MSGMRGTSASMHCSASQVVQSFFNKGRLVSHHDDGGSGGCDGNDNDC